MIRIPIEKMTKKEKLAAMELLWADLTRDPDAYESPGWHEEELRKTKERVEFCDRSGTEVGDHFLNCLRADIESLGVTKGVHPKVYGFYRLISERFPFAVYYDFESDRLDSMESSGFAWQSGPDTE